MRSVYDLDRAGLVARLQAWGEPAYRGRQVYRQLWRSAATYEEMSNVPRALRERLREELPLGPRVVREQGDEAETVRKAVLETSPGRSVEAVSMAYPNRTTLCISSQSGCAMACTFCATGTMGLLGNLTAGEIASQVIWGRRLARAAGRDGAPNIVFMGMGEPLSNYRGVSEAIVRLTDPEGMGLSPRRITVSTVGVIPGILRLGADHPQVRLAVSLHAADDDLRTTLVPSNALWPLADLMEAVGEWRRQTGRRPSFEWTLMREVNDDPVQARALAALAKRVAAHVNVIPFNPVEGLPYRTSRDAAITRFVRAVEDAGVPITLRDTRGKGIDAACGQLQLSATAHA